MKHAPRKQLLVLLTGWLLCLPALAGGLSLPTGGSRVIALSAPTASFHIADPGVLDARAIDDSHVELIAKAPGSTLVAAYDTKGRLVYSGRVQVGAGRPVASSHGDSGTVLYQRGTSQIVYQCNADRCQSRSPVQPTQTASAPATAAAALAPPH